jgi:beta-lactamase class A
MESRKRGEASYTRRRFLRTSMLATGTFLAWGMTRSKAFDIPALDETLARLEGEIGGRLGAALLDCGTGRVSGHRLDESFPMCSTFKVLAVAAVLSRVDRGTLNLHQRIPIAAADILSYAPITSQHVGASGMTIAELCEAAITVSDNTAANLLLNCLGGPASVTKFAQSLGDSYTRLDRIEPTLNEATPGDPRDTTTPRVMAQDLKALMLGNALSASSRAFLKDWMVQCKTGDQKIRSAVSKEWLVGDKTGSGSHNTSNDVAILWPGSRPPLILSIYLTGLNSDSSGAQADMIAGVARTCLRVAGSESRVQIK